MAAPLAPLVSDAAKAMSDKLATADESVFDDNWKGTLMRFDDLLEALRNVPAVSDGTNPEEINRKGMEFFRAVDEELTRISKVFQKTAYGLKGSNDKGRWLGKRGPRVVSPLFTSMHVGRGVKVANTQENVFVHAAFCSHYAKLSREALRAIMACHDERVKSFKGVQYIEAVWVAGDQRGLFLHSALLREVDALQILMARKLGEVRCKELVPTEVDCAGEDSSHRGTLYNSYSIGGFAGIEKEGQAEDIINGEAGAPDLSTGVAANVENGIDDDGVPDSLKPLISCPICLEYMFRPFGLACGHCTCLGCLLRGNGLERSVAPKVRSIMSHLPYRNGKCPICRQKITNPPRELTALGRLIAKTAPEYYQNCAETYKKSQDVLKDKLEYQNLKELNLEQNPLFPFLDRLPGLFRSKSKGRSAGGNPHREEAAEGPTGGTEVPMSSTGTAQEAQTRPHPGGETTADSATPPTPVTSQVAG